jgi:hypothetical protein
MTDFFQRLKALRHTWTVHPNGSIRNQDDQCPLCAVGGSGQVMWWGPACLPNLKLLRAEATEIEMAADNRPIHDDKIRSLLLEACGL